MPHTPSFNLTVLSDLFLFIPQRRLPHAHASGNGTEHGAAHVHDGPAPHAATRKWVVAFASPLVSLPDHAHWVAVWFSLPQLHTSPRLRPWQGRRGSHELLPQRRRRSLKSRECRRQEAPPAVYLRFQLMIRFLPCFQMVLQKHQPAGRRGHAPARDGRLLCRKARSSGWHLCPLCQVGCGRTRTREEWKRAGAAPIHT